MTDKQRDNAAKVLLTRMRMYNLSLKKGEDDPCRTAANLRLELDGLWEICNALDIEVIINRNDSLKYNSVVLNGKKYKV